MSWALSTSLHSHPYFPNSGGCHLSLPLVLLHLLLSIFLKCKSQTGSCYSLNLTPLCLFSYRLKFKLLGSLMIPFRTNLCWSLHPFLLLLPQTSYLCSYPTAVAQPSSTTSYFPNVHSYVHVLCITFLLLEALFTLLLPTNPSVDWHLKPNSSTFTTHFINPT